nr:hypothetical protein [Saprospiraceae bacterium]
IVVILLCATCNLVYSSCVNNSESDKTSNSLLLNDTGSKTIGYYGDNKNGLFICVEKKDSLISVYEFFKNHGVIRKCSNIEKDSMIGLKCEDFGSLPINGLYLDNTVFLQQNSNKDYNTTDSLSLYYSSRFDILDSAMFWNEVGNMLDSFTFVLPKDKDLLDFSYSSSIYEDQTVVLRTLDFKGSTISNEFDRLPKLFFHVDIDQKGNITHVEYNSWGTEVYKNILGEIEKKLISRSIHNYQILQYPVKVKLPIGVVVKHTKLP